MSRPGGGDALALCVGHFHVLRHADLAALRRALAIAPRCLVVIGSAHLPRSPRNPFTWDERADVIRRALTQEERGRVRFEPLGEWFDDARTSRRLQFAVRTHSAQAPVVLVRTPTGLAFEPAPQWQVDAFVPDVAPDEAELRDRLLSTDPVPAALAAVAAQVPAATAAFLAAWTASPDFERLRQEWHQIAGEKKTWSVVPYPVVLVTVDAVVRAGDHVLLIRRGHSPGKGLRALPGGFLETRESVLDGAVRELLEETQLAVPADAIRAALRGVHAFDYPRRSQRGRVITHAHYFDLGASGGRPLPQVLGSDDAAAAAWVPIAELPALQAQFVDDHYFVLDHFLGLAEPLPGERTPNPPAPAAAGADRPA